MNIPFKIHTYSCDFNTTLIPTSASFSCHIWELEIKNKTEEVIQRKVKLAICRKAERKESKWKK